MQLIEIQEMPLEELKADFKDMMQEIVERNGDEKDEQSAESAEQTSNQVR